MFGTLTTSKLEYVGSVLDRMNDPSYFWRRRYNQKVKELAAMKAELCELEKRSELSNQTAVAKHKKQKVDESTNPQWRFILNMSENEDEDTTKIMSVLKLLNSGNQLEKDLCLEAGRTLLSHLKLWKYEDDGIVRLTMPALIKTCGNFLRNNYYAVTRSFFASIIEWFYEQFARALKTPIVVYCHDCIAGLVSTDCRMGYVVSIEICKLLTRKRAEVSQPALLNRESKKQQLLSAYYFFISILQIANSNPPLNKLRHIKEQKELQKCRTEMEKAFLENKDKFTRIADHLCLIKWKLL